MQQQLLVRHTRPPEQPSGGCELRFALDGQVAWKQRVPQLPVVELVQDKVCPSERDPATLPRSLTADRDHLVIVVDDVAVAPDPASLTAGPCLGNAAGGTQ